MWNVTQIFLTRNGEIDIGFEFNGAVKTEIG